MIIAFEGIDGAGKNTLVTAVEAELIAREYPVARVSFPRYEESAHAQLAQEALNGNMGDLIESTYGMATLFALDRAEVAGEITQLSDDGYIVLLDRYVASNAAYSAAREFTAQPALHKPADSLDVVEWVEQLEFVTMGSPVPGLQVFVDASTAIAAQRAQDREATDASRTRDAYESNSDLQENTAAAYRHLAEVNWQSPWLIIESDEGGIQKRAEQLADEIAATTRETD